MNDNDLADLMQRTYREARLTATGTPKQRERWRWWEVLRVVKEELHLVDKTKII